MTAQQTRKLAYGMIAVHWLFVLFWFATGDLNWLYTALGGFFVFDLPLWGLARLAVKRPQTAAWGMVFLLETFVWLTAAPYGGVTSTIFWLVFPHLLAMRLNRRSGLWMMALDLSGVWALALAGYFGWITFLLPFEESQLTFDAPVLTGLFLLLAWLSGWEAVPTVETAQAEPSGEAAP